jgi:hypothetical protein
VREFRTLRAPLPLEHEGQTVNHDVQKAADNKSQYQTESDEKMG